MATDLELEAIAARAVDALMSWHDEPGVCAAVRAAIMQSVPTSNPRAQELFAALLDFLNQWKNRGETTSLHEWHMRMKESAERAEAVLNKTT